MELDKSLVSGSMALLVLKLLEDCDMYGYQMIEALKQRSDESRDAVPPAPRPGGKGARLRL